MNKNSFSIILILLINPLLFLLSSYTLCKLEFLFLQYVYLLKNIVFIASKEVLAISWLINMIISFYLLKYCKQYTVLFENDKNLFKIPYVLDKSFIKYVSEYIRPWKLSLLSIIVLFLCIGAKLVNLPDWDITISVIMAIMSYLFSPISMSYIIFSKKENKWQKYFIAMLLFLLTVDTVYCYYNSYYGHLFYRESNFFASSILYMLNGFILMYKGNLKGLIEEIKKIKLVKKSS